MAKNRWGGDDMDDWPITVTADRGVGPEVGQSYDEYIFGLQYEKGNRIKSTTKTT
ncbi:MAG: hypothetical protein VZQ83_08825 [Eubacterium sp.]|nr:hypothetical protein [Eubacterium sp.]